MVPSPPTAMTAPASVVEVDDREDDLPLNSLRTVIGAQKIVDEKRKEEEALAAEPSLGFNDEWCKAHQDKVASSFKIQDLYGHMMPPQDGQSPIPVLAQFLSIVSNNNVFAMVKAAKGAKKGAKDGDTWAKALTEINATIIKNICVVRRQGSKRTKDFFVARPIATSQNGQKLKELVTTMLDEYEIQTDKNMRCVDKANASELFGFDPPVEVATTITSELQSLCNARNDMNRIKDKTKEGHEAEEKKKQVNQALVKQMLKGDRKRKMAAAAAGGVAIMSPGATDDDLEEPESLDDCGNEGGKRPKRRNTLSIMEMREKNKKKKLELQELALEDKKQDRAAKRKKDEAQAKKDEAQAKLLEALVAKMTKENE